MKPFFECSSYDTPENTRRFLSDRLALNTRIVFFAKCIEEIFRSRGIALSGRYDRKAWAESSYRVFSLIERCGGRFHIRGLAHLCACREPVVFISNHMSTLETFVFPSIIAPVIKVTFIVKESLMTHPLFGPVMRARDPIVVKRENPREDFQTVMRRGKEFIGKGFSVIVFPQSTRTEVFHQEEFNTLGIKLARAAGVRILPVAIKTDFWGNGKYLKDAGPIRRDRPIHIVFGEPFAISGNGKAEHQRVVDFIVDHLRQWGGLIAE
jgi:1-acyl-sn-glycerol-3-phosphate acyltransferase